VRTISLLLLIAASAAGAGAWFIGRSGLEQEKLRPKKTSVYRPNEVAANGIVEGQTPVIELRSELVGTIAAIHYRENESVTKGSLLVELKNDTQREHVAVAEAEVAVAKAALTRLRNGEQPEKRKALADAELALKAMYEHAQAKLKRIQAVSDKGVGSADQLEDALYTLERVRAEYERAKSERALVEAPAREDEVLMAQARIRAAEARLALAKAELARTQLLAPSDGTILQRFAEPGDMAGPSSVHPILVLANLSRLRVRAFVEELDVNRVQVGQAATITADGIPEKKFSGVVTQVLPRMGKRGIETNAPGEYRDIYHREVLIDLDEGQALPVSLRVRVRIETRSPHPPAAEVPSTGQKNDPSKSTETFAAESGHQQWNFLDGLMKRSQVWLPEKSTTAPPPAKAATTPNTVARATAPAPREKRP
jgi:HlyD family secretion protein